MLFYAAFTSKSWGDYAATFINFRQIKMFRSYAYVYLWCINTSVAYFNLLYMHLSPQLWLTLFRFCWDLQRQKTRVPGRCLPDSTFSCFDTISEYVRQTDRQTHNDSIYCASIASCCKNSSLLLPQNVWVYHLHFCVKHLNISFETVKRGVC